MKKFGLNLPSKPITSVNSSRPSVFDDDTSEDEASVSNEIKRIQEKTKKQELDIYKNEDPTVYQFDEVYEEKTINKPKDLTDKDKQPRYMSRFMQMAEERKIEKEQRNFKKFKGQFDGNEQIFVTEGYKEKMMEIQEKDSIEVRGSFSKLYENLYARETKPVNEEILKDGNLPPTLENKSAKSREKQQEMAKPMQSADQDINELNLHKNDESSIISARERYLARKRLKET